MQTYFIVVRYCILSIIFVITCVGSLYSKSAEESSQKVRELAAVRRADQKTAADAFRAGDTAAGLAYIEKHVKTGVKAPNKELQVARSLSSVACILANERSYQRSREVALIALNKLSSEKRVAMKSAENLSALRLSAEIYDIILNDTSAAIRAYKAVLAANEKDKRAAQRVAFLESRNAVILARAKEIEAAKIKR